MLCPGCVTHGIPQAQKIHATFAAGDVAVVGVRSVFEHHEAMRIVSLRTFVHEYRIEFPVAIDEPDLGSPIPKTMQAFQMRGTPTLILIDRLGRIRLHAFGRLDDMAVGAAIAGLASERGDTASCPTSAPRDAERTAACCDEDGCRV